MDETVIFSLVRAGKRYGTKTVFSDITLRFFPGAKIGIIGPNGSGKTTLMKIMAGLEKEFDGDRMMSDQVTVGYLPQEPSLTPGQAARETVTEGVSEMASLLREYDDISARFTEPMSDD